MIQLKCESCGGACEYIPYQGYECTYCHRKITGKMTDRVIADLNLAITQRLDDYDCGAALNTCKEILKSDPDNQEVIWNALLSECGVIDKKEVDRDSCRTYIATFIDPENVSIKKSKYYGLLGAEMKHEADLLEERRLNICEQYKTCPRYDVFICYKKHEISDKKALTREAAWAAVLYKKLKKQKSIKADSHSKLRVFYADAVLKENNAEWEAQIFAALKSAKCMVVLCSSAENVNSDWVKNEWMRFNAIKKLGDTSKTIIPVVADEETADNLPPVLNKWQAVIYGSESDAKWSKKLFTRIIEASVLFGTDDLLTEANDCIRKKKFKAAKKLYKKVIGKDSANIPALWGLLKCRLKAFDDYDIVRQKKKLSKMKEFIDVQEGLKKNKAATDYVKKVMADQLDSNKRKNPDIQQYPRDNYNYWLKWSKPRRVFKKALAIFCAFIIAVLAIFGGVKYCQYTSNIYTFNLDYGQSAGVLDTMEVFGDQPIPDLPAGLSVEDKPYMDFCGWYTQPDCKGIQVAGPDGKSTSMLEGNLKNVCDKGRKLNVYAGFKSHIYSITFYDNDGHTVLKSVGAEYGTPIDELGSDIFVGEMKVLSWSETLNGPDFSGSVSKDADFYANSFGIDVIYDSNGGSPVESVSVRVGDKVPMPVTEREYYGFEGWAYNGELVQYGFTAPQENITLVAQWSKTHFSLTLNSNGVLEDTTEIVKAGSTVSLPVLNRQYYGFLGWEYNGSLFNDSFIMPQKDVVLTAKWEKTHFVLTLDSNGVEADKTEIVKAGSAVSLPILNRQYYRFVGWEYNGSVVNNSFIMPQNDVVLKAKWEKTHYYVTFDGGSGQYVRIGDSISLPTRNRTGYDFKGWYYGGTVYNGRFTPEKDTAFTSKWEARTYVISLNYNGGTESASTKNITYGQTYTLPVPVKAGFEFAGWFTGTGRSATRMTDKNGASLSGWDIDRQTTLYAMWTSSYEIKTERESCKKDNGYNPANGGTEIDGLAHGDWDMLSLVIGGCVQDGSDYFIPQGSSLSVSFKVLQNIDALPRSALGGHSVNWTKHWMQSDTYSGQVYGTNLSGKAVGKGAYYIKVTYTDGTITEANGVDFLNGAQNGATVGTSLSVNTGKKVSKLEIVAVYELYYDYMSNVMDWDGTKCTANWRCTATVNFI